MTDKQKKQIEANPRIKRFVESGDCDNASRLISMSYLLFTIAQSYSEEAMDILKKYGLHHFNLKYFAGHLIKAFDTYAAQLASMVPDMDAKKQFIIDYEIFEPICREYMEKREVD